MASLEALQPDAATIFQDAFDEAVGADTGKELQNMRRPLKPKLVAPGIPLNHLRWAFKLAHGHPLRPIGTRVAAAAAKNNMIEPHPREVIANYLSMYFQMMYVSGETGEPSVETTGIIEDIVRQQVIEIVSLDPGNLL
jgi:hypothetical protein